MPLVFRAVIGVCLSGLACSPASTCDDDCDAGGRPALDLCARVGDRPRVCRAPEEALQLDLGEVALGARSEVVVEVSSDGDVPATLEDVRLVGGDDWSIEGEDTPLVLSPGSKAEFRVVLDASAPGPASASVVFDLGEVGEGVLRLQVRADVVEGCRPMLDPREHDFGAVDVGERASVAIVLANEGQATCSVLAPPSVVGPLSAHFEFVDLPVVGAPLVPGARHPFTVRFAPTTRLERFAVGLNVELAVGEEAPVEVATTLRGSAVVPPACRLASPTLAVGDVEDFERREADVTLRNTGDGPCALSGWRVVGQASQLLSPVGALPEAIAPGASVTVRWRAWGARPFDFAGASPTVLLVQTNDVAGHPAAECLSFDASSRAGCVRIDVTGRRVPAGLTVEPSPPDLGVWFSECRSEPHVITLRNATSAQLTVSGVSIGSPFELLSASTDAVLGPSRTLDTVIQGLPATTGGHEGLLQANGSTTGVQGAREYAWPVTGRTEPRPLSVRVTLEPVPESVDILFVIDNSGSMAARQTVLAEAIPTFVASLDASLWSWQAGVVTTDVRHGGRLRGAPAIVVPGPDAGTQLSARVRQGTNGSADEQGLAMMRLALSEPALSGANAGFLRPRADLRVVVLTDEPDSSPDNPAYYASFLGGVVAAPYTAALWAIAEATGGRYAEVAGSTGGQWTSFDATSGVYVSFLGSMVQALPQRGVRFRLPEPVDAGTLRVRVDAVPVSSSGWALDAVSNEVVFETSNWPTRDNLVEAEFRPACP